MMKATVLVFRLRYVIYAAIYTLGFLAPWDRFLRLDRDRTAWLLLAAWPASNHWLSFTTATVAILILGILCALAAAVLRTWAAAYPHTSISIAKAASSFILRPRSVHVDQVTVTGPFRFLRYPLSLGIFIHTFALSLLMPPSGAIFSIVLIGLFELLLISREEAFLTNMLGEAYLAYRTRVPGLIPALTPRVPASPTKPQWLHAFLGELYFWGVFLAFVIAGWRYNAFLIIQGVLISLGASLVARAFMPKTT